MTGNTMGDESPITSSHVETAAKAAWVANKARSPAEIVDMLPSWESAFESFREDWRASTRAALEAYVAVKGDE
jgi:hypothetical protein